MSHSKRFAFAPTRRLAITGALSAAALAGPLRAAAASEEIRLRALYEKDLSFSPLAESLDGETVFIRGFMAPPLKAEMKFFVLTKMPMSVCPFCETEAEWPDDILAVYTKRVVDVVDYRVKIRVRGELALGGFTDPETGFVSRVRVTDASFERV